MRIGLFLTLVLVSLSAGAELCPIQSVGSLETASISSGTSLSIAVPIGVAEGDVLIAQVAVRDDCVLGLFCNNITPPSGWTPIREDTATVSILFIGLVTTIRQSSYFRVATSSEPASYTWNFSTSNSAAGGVTAFSGVDPNTPIDAHNGQSGSGSTITAPSVTTTQDGTHLVALFANADARGNTSASAPLEELYRNVRGGSGSSGLAITAGQQEWPTAGPTGNRTSSAGQSSQNIGQLVALQPGVCGVSVPDHFRFEHDGGGLTCTSESIVVRACMDDSCSSEYPEPITATLYPSGWASGDTQTFSSGDTLQLWHTTAGVATLDIASVTGATYPPRCFVGGIEQPSCALPFYDSGFLFDVPHHTAATEQTVTLAAVRTDDATQQCIPTFRNVSKSVNFWSSYNNPASGSEAIAINGTAIAQAAPGTALALTFDANGESALNVNYPDVGNMLLAAQYIGIGEEEGLVMSGQDSFTSKPAGFSLSNIVRLSDGATNPAAANAAGAGFIAAGDPFSVTITAVNALGAATPNFGREVIAEGVKLSNSSPVDVTGAPDLIAPAGGNTPPLITPLWQPDTAYQPGQLVVSGSNVYQAGNGGNSGATFGGGSVIWVDLGAPLDSSTIFNTSGTFSDGSAVGTYAWEEVGIIDFAPRIRDGDYLGAGDVVGAGSGNVGRFFADAFSATLSPADFAPANGSFTYLGQPFSFGMSPSLTITAISRSGNTLLNYQGDFWKLGSSIPQGVPGESSTFLYGDNVGGTAELAAPASAILYGDTSAAAGNLIIPVHAAGDFTYQRPAGPVAPFDADVSLQITLKDSDGASDGASLDHIGFDGDNDTGPFDGTNDKLLRFGRAVLSDSYGRETEEQRLFLWTHYFDGTGFVSNGDDTTTAYSVEPTNPAIPPDLTNPLCSVVSGPVACSDIAVGGSNIGHGQPFSLSAPGPGKSGALHYQLTVESWLQYDWGSGAYSDNPGATATFGIFRGDDRFIYWREDE